VRNERVVTQKDIAAKLNLSQSLVAGVLSGRPNVWASEETRRRIHLAAKDLGYRPNAIARSLRQRCTNIIGFYSGYGYGILDIMDPFTSEVLCGIRQGCEAACKDFLMHGNFRGQEPDAIYQELINGKVDGLILLSPPSDPLVKLLAESFLPVVAIADAVPGLPSVIVDDAAGSGMLARHLAEKGHTRILYRKSPLQTISDLRRLNGFCEAAAETGITVVDTIDAYWDDVLSEREVRWLRAPRGERPTAVVCWNDYVAHLTLDACLGMDLRVPEEIAIVGFDGFHWPVRLAYNLTTVRAHWANVARKAVDLLVARLNGEEAPPETMMPVDLILGDTT
jgi:DNA-binding LacI/PurR family transcriptional regulator